MEKQRSSHAQAVGHRVKIRRESLRLSQGQLATYAGVSRSYVTRLERGEYAEPSYAKLERISRALNCAVVDIINPAERTPDIDPDDPNIDLMFYNVKQELNPDELAIILAQMQLALEAHRQRYGGGSTT